MKTEEVKKMLADSVAKDRIVDVGNACAEKHNISREKLRAATYQLVDEGYNLMHVSITRAKGLEKVSCRILTAPDVSQKAAWTALQEKAEK